MNKKTNKAEEIMVPEMEVAVVETPKKKSKKAKAEKFIFDSVTPAAEFLSTEFDLKITNSKDCLYRALREGRPTHGYSVERKDNGKVVLTKIQK